MQLILASAKIMRSADSGRVPTMTTPIFDDAARRLALELSQWSVTDLAKALHCSAAIAMENHQRFQQFMLDENRIPAILAYYGQAYKHLRADEFSADDFRFAQDHLRILSFLYGALRPLDGIRLYRLEGKVTSLSASRPTTVYCSIWLPRSLSIFLTGSAWRKR